MEEEKLDIYDLEEEILESKVEDGKIELSNGLHSLSKRAQKFNRLDRVTLEELNVALEYFNYRCAYTGQKFVEFEDKISGKKTNLSIDHIVALVSGGHNIAQNMIPSVLQYNVAKNGYHLLDWYKKQETPSGEKIYNPYRLLKLYNYMAKSLSAMDLKGEEYRQAILDKNNLDNYLENYESKIYSDEITSYEVYDDETSLIQKIPGIKGEIAHLDEEQNTKYSEVELSEFMNNMLLELQESEIDKEIIEEAKSIFENLSNRDKVFQRIPKEEKVQAEVIEYLKTLGCESYYTIARTIDISKIIEQNISAREYLEPKIQLVQDYLKDLNIQSLSLGAVLDNIPQIIESENKSEEFISLDIEIPEHMEELKRLEINPSDKSIRNINAALKIVNEYNFEDENSLGRKLSDEEKKILIKSILSIKTLNSGRGCCYLSTLYKKLTEKEFNNEEVYGVIINYAIGNNGSYSRAISGYENKEKQDLKSDIKLEDIENMLMNNDIILEKDKNELERLGIQAGDKDPKNINTALKIVNEYNFENKNSLGRKLTTEEKKILIESILVPKYLNNGNALYLSTLYKKLAEKGINDEEAYGVIINYAIGNNGDYSSAINCHKNKEKQDLKSDIKLEDIENMLMNNGIILEKDKNELERLGIQAGDKYPKNINTALKIVNEYNFENKNSLGRKLTTEEKKILIESILGPKNLNSGRPKYLSTLYKKLTEKEFNNEEAYGVIINYAIGNNGMYSSAIMGHENKEKQDLKSDIKLEDIETMLMNNGIILEKDKNDLERLGIQPGDKLIQNINAALKIINGYNFEDENSLGRKLTDEERKILIESILGPKILNRNCLSTLYKKLTEKEFNNEEACGVIINYAIGNNGNYSNAIAGSENKEKDNLKSDIKLEDINYMLMNNGIILEKDKKELERLGIQAGDKLTQNINTALKIVNEYNFEDENSVKRKLTDEERKILIESILGPKYLNKKYLSKLYKKLTEKEFNNEEAYGVIINYAIGNNGNYSSAIKGNENKEKDDLKSNIKLEDIEKMKIKAQKKAKKAMKSAVNKASITRIDETLEALEDLSLDSQTFEYDI